MLYSGAMRVKELTLQGFKSFASKHRFAFPPGITAIVGPNGSGKSNIADAVRWVLGEQRASYLRAKRTEQMIFAGTERRPRSGLAEVTLTFDNEDGWLDLDFSEVVVGRRALRDGTNTYTINGAVVRLRDVLDLLGGHLGQGAFTVIGQGLVDNALSMKPEERRVLIDEAAGIVPLQRRRSAAMRKLAETDENLTRVADLLRELGPQLRRMSRLAQRAEQHDELVSDLRDTLLQWYGYQWRRAREQHDDDKSVVDDLEARAATARREAESRADVLRRAEQDRDEAEQALDEARRDRDAVAAELNSVRQAVAVNRARLEALSLQQDELATAGDAEGEALAARRARVADLEAEVRVLEEEHRRLSDIARSAQEDLARGEAEREDRAVAIESAQAALLELRSELAAERRSIDTAQEAMETQRVDLLAAEAELRDFEQQLHASSAEVEEATSLYEATQAARDEVAARTSEIEAQLLAVDRELSEAQARHASARSELEALSARSKALEAMYGQLDASSLLAESLSSSDSLEIVGTVAELVDVVEGWDAAVAAALGDWVNGVVVRDDQAVDKALAVVGGSDRGGVTLVPLASGTGRHSPWSVSEDALPAEAVVSAPDAAGLIDTLLGATGFCADVATARRVLAREKSPTRAATRDGRLVMRHGVVSLASAAREALDIQRQRRALPVAIERASAVVSEHLDTVEGLAARRRDLENQLGDLGTERARCEAEHREAADKLASAQAAAARLERERSWLIETAERLRREKAALLARVEESRRHLAEREPEETQHVAALAAAREALAAIDLSAARENAVRCSDAASVSAQQLAGRRAMLEAAKHDLEQTQERIAAETSRGQAMAHDAATLESEAEALTAKATELEQRLAEREASMARAAERTQQARASLHGLLSAVEEARESLSALEARLLDGRVNLNRSGDRLERLLEQLTADAEIVGLARSDMPEAAAGREEDLEREGELSPTELSGADLGLPDSDELPEGAEEKIRSLRRRLQAIGAIDQEALATFRETQERFEHLEEQRADLEAARDDVVQVLDSLETEMAERFDETFTEVAGAFREFFPKLFQGGEAELVLRGDEGTAPGIEIVARPPGKRRQPLELLSGGERSLTAVALIFALLRVSATPFAVLDEVDAALDEANVGRFRAALESLAERTQIVIITHNRGTIQAADTVYGVTMEEDGASQVISLQVAKHT